MQYITEDVCERKHGRNPLSVEANERVNKPRGQQRVFDFIAENGTGYLKQVCRALGKEANAVSGRFSELKAAGLIQPTGERREGCAVYEVKR